MTDPANRTNSLRIPRTRSTAPRNPSARSFGLYHEEPPRQPPAASAQHGLRAVSSRFSLNEHFAASRREYEFGDDDAASFVDGATLASEGGGDLGGEEGAGVGEQEEGGEDGEPESCCYDVLCLPANAALTQEQIRQAYYRMLLLFYPDNYPEAHRPAAAQYLSRVQEAFETIIDPERRAIYDLDRGVEEDDDMTEAAVQETNARESLRSLAKRRMNCSSSLGVRFDAVKAPAGRRRPSPGKKGRRLKPVDFAVGHTLAVELPSWGKGLKRRLEATTTASPYMTRIEGWAIDTPPPTLAISGSVYGVVEDMSRMPLTLVSERYQPLMPTTRPRYQVVRLAERKMSPLVSMTLQQDLLNSAPAPDPSQAQWIKTSISAISDLLPAPSLAAHLIHVLALPNSSGPTALEASIGTSASVPRTPPRLALAARHATPRGTAFVRADSGDWAPGGGLACRFFGEFSRWSRRLSLVEFPLLEEPGVEVGFTTDPEEGAPLLGRGDALCDRGGMSGLEERKGLAGEGRWAVSASASPGSVAGSVRYTRDLTGAVPLSLTGRPARLETELCSTTPRDHYLALRTLWPLGRLSHLGLELGLSTHNIHLSLHWSRPRQRLTLPLLLSQHLSPLSRKALALASALSVAGLALPSLILHVLRRRRGRQLDAAAVARHRLRADALSASLAPAVDALQRHRAAQGGPVVLSAKFGVQDESGGWAGEEVADVTVAVAALVPPASGDGGGAGVVIPAGARKGRLPGFWDPAPGCDKVLHVRYAWRGREGVVEVKGREELVLPPRSMKNE